MSIRQRIFTSDVAAWVVFACSAMFMVATLLGWDPTIGAVDRAWRHPVMLAVLGAAAISIWFACRAKYRDSERNEGLRSYARKGLYLGVIVFLTSLGVAMTVGAFIR